MRRICLIMLSLGVFLWPSMPSYAETDYQCLQACVSRGGLYLDCEARCTRITPSPGPGAGTQTPAPVQTPTGSQIPAAPKAPSAPVAAPVPKPTQPPPAAGAPRQAQTPIKQQQGEPTLPASTVDQRCVLLCKDKGHLYDYCAKVCSH